MPILFHFRAFDFVNLMSYDLNGAWNKSTGHNSPLFPRSDEKGEERYLNIVGIHANYSRKLSPDTFVRAVHSRKFHPHER